LAEKVAFMVRAISFLLQALFFAILALGRVYR
jgi:hypothetical protein